MKALQKQPVGNFSKMMNTGHLKQPHTKEGDYMDLNKKNIKRILGLITFTALLCAILLNMKTVMKYMDSAWGMIFPFILGAAIAFILNIPMSFIEKRLFLNRKAQRVFIKKAARPLSLVLAILFVCVVIAIVFAVVLPQLGNTIESVSVAMRAFIPRAENFLIQYFGDNEYILDFINSIEISSAQILNSIKDFAFDGATNILSYTMSATKMVINGIVTFFIAIIFACYILVQKENLGRQFSKVISAVFNQRIVKKTNEVFGLSAETFSRFITGQCLEAIILGTMFFVIMLVFRFPYPLLVGVTMAFTALIPIVGAFAGCFLCAFLILMINPMQALAFIIIFFVLQQIEGNFIYPYVVGNSVGLPAIWVLAAVTIGGKLMGVVGMLIFIPLVSVVYTLFRKWVNKRLKEKKLL